MPGYKIHEVQNDNDRKSFLDLPSKLYRDDPNYIRPLDKDVESVFDPKRNKHFRNGEAVRYLLFDNENLVCGRIAAFYNKQLAEKNSPTRKYHTCVHFVEAVSSWFSGFPPLNKMLHEVKKIAPTIFKNAGPSCKTKKICPENNKKCPLYPK